jgi:hypothetical protein
VLSWAAARLTVVVNDEAEQRHLLRRPVGSPDRTHNGGAGQFGGAADVVADR